MRFTKIKSSDKGVHLEWTTPAEKHPEDLVEHKLVSEEAAAPEFTAALEAFVPEVLRLLELPSLYGMGLVVSGLSINYEDDGRLGLVVTCLKKLERTNSPLVVNTPHLREADDEGAGNFLPNSLLELIAAAEAHASAYVQGTRAQGNLFNAAEEFRKGIPEGGSVTVSSGKKSVTLTL